MSNPIIRAMEDFGDSEPVDLVVVYTNEKGDLVIQTDLTRTRAVGVLKCAEHLALHGPKD